MRLQQFNAQLPSSFSLGELAMIDGLDLGARLRAGQTVKPLIGTPVVPDSPRP